jgi:hypothetical protein
MTRSEFDNFGDEGWCSGARLVLYQQQRHLELPEAHAAAKPLSGQAVRYKSHLPGHSLQLSWAGRRVGTILYAFRPLWVHSSAVPCQYRVEIFKKENNLFFINDRGTSCPLDLPSEGHMRLPLSAGGGMQPPPPPLFGFGEVRICCIWVPQLKG